MPKPNNQIKQKIRESFQCHMSVDIPPHDIFGLRIACTTDGRIEIFKTSFVTQEKFQSSKECIDDDDLNFAECRYGFNEVCVFEYVATIDIDEFLPRMEGFIAALKILNQSGLQLNQAFIELETTEDE